MSSHALPALLKFQSTLPAWGATLLQTVCRISCNFNPRSPRGERPYARYDVNLEDVFQSTLPAWGATRQRRMTHRRQRFQSTLPAWGATRKDGRRIKAYAISIHAPRVGSDVALPPFLPRSTKFQSTLPAWGAT